MTFELFSLSCWGQQRDPVAGHPRLPPPPPPRLSHPLAPNKGAPFDRSCLGALPNPANSSLTVPIPPTRPPVAQAPFCPRAHLQAGRRPAQAPRCRMSSLKNLLKTTPNDRVNFPSTNQIHNCW